MLEFGSQLLVQTDPVQELAVGLKVRLLSAPGLEGMSEVMLDPTLAQLDQALAPLQALPLALESSGALEVVVEQEKQKGLCTYLAFTAFPKTGKVSLPVRELQAMKNSLDHLPRL